MSRQCWLSCLLFFVGPSALCFADDPIDFNRDIRPLLSDRCFACHGPDDNTREADLRLDLAEGVVEGDVRVVHRGDLEGSELYQRITSTDEDLVMPPASTNKPLSDDEKDLIRRWIEQGAVWETHWAYVTPVKVEPPLVDGMAAANPIDGFIRARLTKAGLTPSAEADRVTLIRRLYFDLIGLPPTPAQVDAFVNDTSPTAYAKVVEDLLQSPHFGERLAIYWLDVVRYADSNGYHSDEPRQIAPYRDYVIEAFNGNMPYDQFVVEQLAGDLLPEAGMQQHIASGFNMLLQTTSEGGAQPKEYIAKYAADRVRNTSQIFLGSTMGCAECHNHKFDPFTKEDFYSFAAFFADIQQPAVGNPATFPVLTPDDQKQIDQFDARIADLQKILGTSTPELQQAQIEWETQTLEHLNREPDIQPWYAIGPFSGNSFDETHSQNFVDPQAVDVQQPVGDRKWEAVDYADGQVHALSLDTNAAIYLHRRLSVDQATRVKLSLGSDDSLTVWLNGEVVHENKVSRAAAADQDSIEADLPEGESELLVKIANDGGGAGFYFQTSGLSLPANIAKLLQIPADQRTEEQSAELATYFRSISPLLQSQRDELAQQTKAKQQLIDSRPRTMMTKIGAPREVRLLNRGNWLDESGPVMQPQIPEFLGAIDPGTERANRLDLARWIVDRNNPLTARTFVNRLWKLYFGQGLATPLDDLGRQGLLPTHPQLLDWLAVEFMDQNWDVKHMIRLMVMSDTYRQATLVNDELTRVDPYNKLYARQARFRLDAELVRDNALAVSGLLVQEIGGRSVYPYQPAGYWSHMNFPVRSWPTDNGANLYRRGVYTWWQRMFLHPAMQAFDAPTREECTVERPRSNIPQQALVLLNDPAFVEAAKALAERIMRSGVDAPEDRIAWVWKEVLSREPTPRELGIVMGVYQEHLEEFEQDPQAAEKLLAVGAHSISSELDQTQLAAWTSVSRVLLNLNETITRP